MNWPGTSTIATSAICAIGGYYIYKKIKEGECHDRQDITEESIESDGDDDSSWPMSGRLGGHGDQISYRVST